MPASRTHRTSSARRYLAEAIEPRLLLAASIIDGVLTVDGTSGNDELLVNFLVSGEYIAVTNGAGQSFGATAGITGVVVNGFDGNDTIRVLRPFEVPVLLNGGAGNDTLEGNNGPETLDGGAGNDALTGNGGVDTVTYAGRAAAVSTKLTANFFLAGTALGTGITGSGGEPATATAAAEVDTYANVEVIVGGLGNDTLAFEASRGGNVAAANLPYPTIPLGADGGAGADTISIRGYGATDPGSAALAYTVNGGAGNDTLDFGGTSAGTLAGGDGDDTIRQSSPGSLGSINGDAGADFFDASSASDVRLTVPAGVERLVAGTNARVTGTSGDDDITIATGTIVGGAGDDRLAITIRGAAFGQGGNDTLIGTAGLDPFVGVSLVGGANSDRILGGSGPDTIEGGGGRDTIFSNGGADRVNGGADDDTIDGGTGDDRLDGGSGDDQVAAGFGDDRLYGNDGDDVLRGGNGRDRLSGGAGDDLLDGGRDRDVLYGGAGADSRHQDDDDRIINGIEQLVSTRLA